MATKRTDLWKNGSLISSADVQIPDEQANAELTEDQLRTAAAKFRTIRQKMQAARDGFNNNTLTTAQQRKAWGDIADAVNDITGYLAAQEKTRTFDYTAPPEA